MNADALFQRHGEAWSPREDATNLKVLYATDVPTAGTFDVDGATVLFRCLSGHLDRASLWAYVQLDSRRAKEVTSMKFGNGDQLAQWLDERFTNQRVWFATAVDDEIDCWSERIDVSEDLLTKAVGFLENLLRARKGTPENVRRIEQARLDAELRELGATFA